RLHVVVPGRAAARGPTGRVGRGPRGLTASPGQQPEPVLEPDLVRDTQDGRDARLLDLEVVEGELRLGEPGDRAFLEARRHLPGRRPGHAADRDRKSVV